MVKHIIIWKLRDELNDAQRAEIKAGIKQNLEALVGKIEGLVSVNVIIDVLPTSNCDLMLDSTFESAEALRAYAAHPEHVAVADRDVRPYTAARSCIDFEI